VLVLLKGEAFFHSLPSSLACPAPFAAFLRPCVLHQPPLLTPVCPAVPVCVYSRVRLGHTTILASS